jgi:hypothetical protein
MYVVGTSMKHIRQKTTRAYVHIYLYTYVCMYGETLSIHLIELAFTNACKSSKYNCSRICRAAMFAISNSDTPFGNGKVHFATSYVFLLKKNIWICFIVFSHDLQKQCIL